MLRKIGSITAVTLLLAGLAIAPAGAGTPRVVVAENFGATW